MKHQPALLLSIGLGLLISFSSAERSLAQSAAPPITVETVPSDDPPVVENPAQPPVAKAAPEAPAAPKKKSTEVLPWADKPLVPMATASTGDPGATEAAAAQCGPLFEAACRDLKTCAWVADIATADGTVVPARCVARPPAPPKSVKKKTPPPVKKVAKDPAETAAPAVKAAVTRIEEEPPAAKPEKKAATELSRPTPPQETEKAEEPEKTEEAKAPIVVKPPPEAPSAPPKAQMPSFGSVSPIMPGAGNAVVVTVPPSE